MLAYDIIKNVSGLQRVDAGSVSEPINAFLKDQRGEIEQKLSKETVAFLKEAQVEVKKVVWPTRQETLQTTFFVLVVVVIFAILLWLLDLLLSSIVGALI